MGTEVVQSCDGRAEPKAFAVLQVRVVSKAWSCKEASFAMTMQARSLV